MNRHVLRLILLLGSLLLVAGLSGCALFQDGPSAVFDVLPVVAYVDEPVTFDASSSTGGASLVSYQWTISGGTTLAGMQATTTFTAPGIYSVTLRIADAQGQSASVTEQITVFVRSGTTVFSEDFGDGETALGRWPLDPTWASESESSITYITNGYGYVLYIHSGNDRWHRRYVALDLPPLRLGQRLVFTWKAMTLHTQDSHTFMMSPVRASLDSMAEALPFYVYSSESGGSLIRQTSTSGTVVDHSVAFDPDVYRWHRYSLSYDADSYEFAVDDVVWDEGMIDSDVVDGGTWYLILGEESQTEACSAYYDDILVTVEE